MHEFMKKKRKYVFKFKCAKKKQNKCIGAEKTILEILIN